MELDDIRSAIRDVEKELKSVRNKIGHRQRQADSILVDVAALRASESELVDRYVSLVAKEQKIVRPGDDE